MSSKKRRKETRDIRNQNTGITLQELYETGEIPAGFHLGDRKLLEKIGKKSKKQKDVEKSIIDLIREYQEDIQWDDETGTVWIPTVDRSVDISSKDKWMNENSYKSQLLGSTILPMKPDFGFYISVFDLDISEDMFKEEYDKITEAYFSVIDKMDKHYKNKKNKK